MIDNKEIEFFNEMSELPDKILSLPDSPLGGGGTTNNKIYYNFTWKITSEKIIIEFGK